MVKAVREKNTVQGGSRIKRKGERPGGRRGEAGGGREESRGMSGKREGSGRGRED